jgi:hypothetical protein
MCIDASMRPYRYLPASLHIVFSMSCSAFWIQYVLVYTELAGVC